MRPNRIRYLLSLADEIHSQATRVRDLIGDAHWLSDGHHKEYLLISLLERHLPSALAIKRGFVLGPSDETCSKEQDILIIDTSKEPPVFNQGGLIASFPHSVLAAISVKTTLTKPTLLDSINGLSTVRGIAAQDGIDTRQIWCGAFFFEPSETVQNSPDLVYSYFQEGVRLHPTKTGLLSSPHQAPVGPDFLCTSRDFAFKVEHGYSADQYSHEPASIRGYRCGGAATPAFIASLLGHITSLRGIRHTSFEEFADCIEVEAMAKQVITTA